MPWRERRRTIAQKFSLTMAALIAAMVALAVVGVVGLGQLRDGARGLEQSVRETGLDARTRAELLDFTGKLQLYTVTNDQVLMRALRATIEQRLVRIDDGLAEMRRLYARKPIDLELTRRQEAPYRRLVDLWRSGAADVTGTTVAAEARKTRLIRSIQRDVDRIGTAAAELARRDVGLAAAARARADDKHTRTWQLMLAVLVAAVVCSVGILILLIRDVVPRTRRYSRFAADVAAGRLDERALVRGSDELAELGQTLNLMVDGHEAERRYAAGQQEFAETLQVAEDEPEAHEVLKLHLERSIPSSSVVVLNRNNSHDRLEPTMAVEPGSALAEGLDGAVPRSCLAVRLARPHHRRPGDDTLLKCEVCGKTPNPSACSPLLVGGEVIGSVLVGHEHGLDPTHGRRIAETVGQAAPVLANLRNLAIAELRAATDALTGLPNARAVSDHLKRLAAQASRSVQPLSIALLDLDHFKQVNDCFGHAQGDQVLAAVGAVLTESLRESDFAGRQGGEEFIVMMPDTDHRGALVVAENLRQAIATIEIQGVTQPITASLGVATIPDHAGDADRLLRVADRALYGAKAAGRDRVESVVS